MSITNSTFELTISGDGNVINIPSILGSSDISCSSTYEPNSLQVNVAKPINMLSTDMFSTIRSIDQAKKLIAAKLQQEKMILVEDLHEFKEYTFSIEAHKLVIF